MKKIAVALICLGFAGCAVFQLQPGDTCSMGAITDAKINHIRTDVTRQDQILSWFGEPDSRAKAGKVDYDVFWVYRNKKCRRTEEGACEDCFKTKRLVIFFYPDGRVQDYLQGATKKGAVTNRLSQFE